MQALLYSQLSMCENHNRGSNNTEISIKHTMSE